MRIILQALAAAFAFCAFLAAPASAAPGRSDVFVVAGVRVDETAANASAARDQARLVAYRTAFERLVRRVASADEAARLIPTLVVDDMTIDRLVTGIDIEEERAAANRYVARMTLNFNPNATRTFLRERGFAVLETRGPPVLVAPQMVGAAPAAVDAWRAAWEQGGFRQELTPLAIAPLTVSGAPGWEVARAAAELEGATRVVFVTVRLVSNGLVAVVEEVGPDGVVKPVGQFTQPVTIGGAQGLAPSLQRLAGAVNDRIQMDWKGRVSAGAAQRVRVGAQALFQSGGDWRRIKSALAQATRTIVSDVRIEAISPKGASLSFAYVGDQPQLAAELQRNGVRVEGEGAALTLRLAGP